MKTKKFNKIGTYDFYLRLNKEIENKPRPLILSPDIIKDMKHIRLGQMTRFVIMTQAARNKELEIMKLESQFMKIVKGHHA